MGFLSLRPDPDRWAAACGSDATCTFFQTPEWVRLVTSIRRGAVDGTAHLVFPDGKEVIVPRVLTPMGGGLFQSAESVPPGVYGAPVTVGGPLDPEELGRVAEMFRGPRMAPSVLVEVPWQPLNLGMRRETMTTHILSLAGSTCEDDLFPRYRKGHRSDVRGAQRAGVEVGFARSREDIAAYHAIYLETAERWSRAPGFLYPVEFFNRLQVLAESLGTVRILMARRGDEVLAGVVVLVHGRHAAYWHAASSEAGRALHAGHLAVHEAIKDAMSLGAEFFDFMPNPGLDPVARYKTGFGAEPVEVGVHRSDGSLPYRGARGLQRLLGGG